MNTNFREKLRASGLSRVFVALAIAGFALCASSTNLHAQSTAAAMQGKTAGQYYKNSISFKDLPADQLHPTMEYINMALGVGCNFCHVDGDFAKDDKKAKNVARQMIAMTFALNTEVFDEKRTVTCFTCHQGRANPVETPLFPGEAPFRGAAREIYPPLAIKDITAIDSKMAPSKAPATVGGPAGMAPAAMPAAATPLPTANDVFAKYQQALGVKVTTIVARGTVDVAQLAPLPGTPERAPVTLTAEVDRKVPNKLFLSTQAPGKPATAVGYDGTIAWTNTREIVGSEADLRKESAEFPPALEFTKTHSKVQVDSAEKIGDHDTYRVVGTRNDGLAVDRLYFDQTTGLLVRSYTTFQTVIGAYPEETNYDDYRVVSGVNVPFTMVVKNSGEGLRTYKWSEVNVNVPLEDAKFAKPSPPPPPTKASGN